jgi:hypothetical protein
VDASLEDKLRAKFPIIFRESVRCGVEHPAGWNDLVEELCAKLELLATDQPEDEHLIVDQTKSKFGTLRFYALGATREQQGLINDAEMLSRKICELCGSNKAGPVGNSWTWTLCPECWAAKARK